MAAYGGIPAWTDVLRGQFSKGAISNGEFLFWGQLKLFCSEGDIERKLNISKRKKNTFLLENSLTFLTLGQ